MHRSTVSVVGIGTFADDVLASELFPTEVIVVTPEAAATADCIQGTPQSDDPRSDLELMVALVPSDCAMTYRYYSIDVEGGPDDAAAVTAESRTAVPAENRNLPAGLREADIGYFLIRRSPTTTSGTSASP